VAVVREVQNQIRLQRADHQSGQNPSANGMHHADPSDSKQDKRTMTN
jgi:hypothetical protein